MAKNKKSLITGNMGRFLVLFSLPFAGIGVGAAYWEMKDIADAARVKSWEETPAKILKAELESHRGDDSTTYEATAEYVYTYNGQRYTGHRVGIQSGSDNVGSFQHDVHRELLRHQKSGKEFRCYVNPKNPAEAILYPELRWQMLLFKNVFAAAFGCAGFGLLTSGLLMWRTNRINKSRKRAHPDEPWLWRRDWAEGLIVSTNKLMNITVVLALYWNIVSTWPAWIVVRDGYLAKHDKWALLGLLFIAVGLVLAIIAGTAVGRRIKYGVSTFQLASAPGVVGGQLAGVVHVPNKVATDEGFCVGLKCVQMITTRSGGKTSTRYVDVWTAEQEIVREMRQFDFDKTAVPVQFAIPFGCLPTDPDGSGKVVWRLEVSAETPGLDYKASFIVPVFKTAQSDPNFSPDTSAIDDFTFTADAP